MSCEFDAYSFQVNGGVGPLPGAPLRALPGPAVRDKGAVAVDGPDGPALLHSAISGHLQDGDAIGDVPFRDSVSRPTGETWWLETSPHTYLDTLKKSGIGVYAVANWDEAGTKHGAFFTFAHLRGQSRLARRPGHALRMDPGQDRDRLRPRRPRSSVLRLLAEGRTERPDGGTRRHVLHVQRPARTGVAPGHELAPAERSADDVLSRRRDTAARQSRQARRKDEVGYNPLVQLATSTTGPRKPPARTRSSIRRRRSPPTWR